MSKYIKLDEHNRATNWPTEWESLEDSPSDNSIELKDEQELYELENVCDPWHCPKWNGEKFSKVLNPNRADDYKQELFGPQHFIISGYLQSTDYVVMKLYEDSLGINSLSDEKKAEYLKIIIERQKRRDDLNAVEQKIDEQIAKELEESNA